MTTRTLVAGIGNIFLGDDGFGVEVAARLAGADLPAGVKVVDYGIRGMHLAYDLSSGYDAAILVDATARGGAPGTIYVIEPEFGAAREPPAAASTPPDLGATSGDVADGVDSSPLLDAHGMQPDVVFSMLDMLGGERPGRVLVVGCEPASIEYAMELSDPVAAAVDEAVRVVLDLVASGEQGEHSVMAAGAPGAGGRSSLFTEGWTHVPRNSR
jgi:hydrogenase maturation protease